MIIRFQERSEHAFDGSRPWGHRAEVVEHVDVPDLEAAEPVRDQEAGGEVAAQTDVGRGSVGEVAKAVVAGVGRHPGLAHEARLRRQRRRVIRERCGQIVDRRAHSKVMNSPCM